MVFEVLAYALRLARKPECRLVEHGKQPNTNLSVDGLHLTPAGNLVFANFISGNTNVAASIPVGIATGLACQRPKPNPGLH